MPEVSVIIPAYNAEQFILKTIESVFAQAFEDFELIAIDDGSTDKTLSILEGISDKRFRFITIKNGGVSKARNLGYRESKGDFLAFLDADDIWRKDNLTYKVDFLRKNENYGLVHSNCEVIDESGISTGEIKVGKAGSILDDLLLWNGTGIPAPSSILVRRSVIEKIGGFDSQLSTAADQEFFFRVASKYLIGHINEITWGYRVHGSNMHQNIKRMEEDHIRAYQLARKNNLFKSYIFRRKCFSNLYMILAGSWWVNSNKHPRTFLFLLKSISANPFNIFNVVRKLF